jgi:hypothetical protein
MQRAQGMLPSHRSLMSERIDPLSMGCLVPSSKGSFPLLRRVPPLGRRILQTSYLFAGVLGMLYRPETHWTGGLRQRAGIPPFVGDVRTFATFTFTDNKTMTEITQFLHDHGPACKVAESWKKQSQPSTVHFDVAITAGDRQSAVCSSSSHIERVRIPGSHMH